MYHYCDAVADYYVRHGGLGYTRKQDCIEVKDLEDTQRRVANQYAANFPWWMNNLYASSATYCRHHNAMITCGNVDHRRKPGAVMWALFAMVLDHNSTAIPYNDHKVQEFLHVLNLVHRMKISEAENGRTCQPKPPGRIGFARQVEWEDCKSYTTTSADTQPSTPRGSPKAPPGGSHRPVHSQCQLHHQNWHQYLFKPSHWPNQRQNQAHLQDLNRLL